jgi:arylsulfatase A-like enzyme
LNRFGLIVLCGLAALAVVPAASAQHPPNVLVILTDDQRAGTMGVMPKTLRLFGRQGRKIPRAFVTTPLCCPSPRS